MMWFKKLICRFKGHDFRDTYGYFAMTKKGRPMLFPTKARARKYGKHVTNPAKVPLKQCRRCGTVAGGGR